MLPMLHQQVLIFIIIPVTLQNVTGLCGGPMYHSAPATHAPDSVDNEYELIKRH
jgi:hypothetical protein